MKRFRFPLQSVLDVKQHEKKEAQRALAQAIQYARETQACVEAWMAQCEADVGVADGASVAAWRACDASRTYRAQQLQYAQRAHEAALDALDVQQHNVVEKSSAHKTWERAKHRALQQYTHELLAQEQQACDERAQSMRHMHP